MSPGSLKCSVTTDSQIKGVFKFVDSHGSEWLAMAI
jgi:hypothetical protein